MSYRKIGGLHFINIGLFGFCWYWRKKQQINGELNYVGWDNVS